jgi:hypothetical protein
MSRRAYLVVIDPPVFDGFPGVAQSEKPVYVQALLADLSWKFSI